MASVLSQVNTPPPAPNPNPQASQPSDAMGPQTLRSAPPQGAGGVGAGVPPQSPAPTHAQTVAALRHFDAIRKETEVLLKNPNLGKADIKGAIIDGMTKLVSSRMLSPAEAVSELSNVPKEPLEQRKWVEKHHQTAMMAEHAVLDHHRMNFVGTGNWDMEQANASPADPEAHSDDIAGLRGHYRG